MFSLKQLVKNPYRVIYGFDKIGVTHLLKDKTDIKFRYRANMGVFPDLDNPKTFNEKLQWLKLNDRKPEYAIMVDKYEAKKYISGIVGEEYVIPTLGVWDNFDDIDFDSLPKQFVLKCTHDSGGVVIVDDKDSLDRNAAKKKITRALKKNFYYCGREWPYKFVKPRIIAEEYLTDFNSAGLIDYKVHNFNGTPKLILVCKDRFESTGFTEDFYSIEWKHLDIRRPNISFSKVETDVPVELDEMLEISRILSKKIAFLRTDFYIVNHKLYIGELTFFPANGFKKFIPEDWDYTLGNWLDLPVNSVN